MIILACLHNCITPHLYAWARRLRRHFTTRSGLFLTTPDLYVQIPEQTTKDFPHLPEHWNGPRSKSSAWRIRLPTSAAETPGCSLRIRLLCSFSRSSCTTFYGTSRSLFILYFCIFVLFHSPSLLTCIFGTSWCNIFDVNIKSPCRDNYCTCISAWLNALFDIFRTLMFVSALKCCIRTYLVLFLPRGMYVCGNDSVPTPRPGRGVTHCS